MIIYKDLHQGTDAWFSARCGILTASEIGKLLTPKGKMAINKKNESVYARLAFERLTGKVDEPEYNKNCERGHQDEFDARLIYNEKVAPVEEVGFIIETFNKKGERLEENETSAETLNSVTLGYSPDGLVGVDGLIEVKSRKSNLQMAVLSSGKVPEEHMAQLQTALLVTKRQWIDYISYPAHGGGPMMVLRVTPDEAYQEALLKAAFEAESSIKVFHSQYNIVVNSENVRIFDTERRHDGEIEL